MTVPGIGISSTNLRHRVAQGRSIRFQVPLAVEQYIDSHQLYQPVAYEEPALRPLEDIPAPVPKSANFLIDDLLLPAL